MGTAVVVSGSASGKGRVWKAANALQRISTPLPQIAPSDQTNGPNVQFIEPVPVGNKFYRLHKP